MAKFTASVPLNIRWLGNEISGAAGATHRIGDEYADEFAAGPGSHIPGFAWVTQDETTAFLPITGGTVSGNIIVNAVTATTIRSKGTPTFDVRAYGALGDGTTNDRAAIQAAIDAAAVTGGTVFVPAGTYKCNTALALKSLVYITGTGVNSILVAGADLDVINAATVDAVVDAMVADIKISGFGSTGVLNRPINLNGVARVTISNVWVDEGSLEAIRVSASTAVRILDSRFTNNRGVMYPTVNIISGSGNIVRGCETSGTSWVSIGLQNSVENLIEGNTLRGNHTGVNVYQASHRNRVIGNDCDTEGAGVTVDGDTTTALYNVVEANHCHDNAAAGISVNNAPNTLVVGNYCRANLGVGPTASGIQVQNSSQSIITGNYCHGNTAYGIRVMTTCHRVTISGNYIFGNGEDGIRISSGNHIAITGNAIYGNAKHGVYNNSGGYSSITGNIVTDNGTATDNTYSGIIVDASRNVISGNTSVNSVALGSQAYGIRIASGTNNCITGNVCFQNETANLSDLGTTSALSNNVTT